LDLSADVLPLFLKSKQEPETQVDFQSDKMRFSTTVTPKEAACDDPPFYLPSTLPDGCVQYVYYMTDLESTFGREINMFLLQRANQQQKECNKISFEYTTDYQILQIAYPSYSFTEKCIKQDKEEVQDNETAGNN